MSFQQPFFNSESFWCIGKNQEFKYMADLILFIYRVIYFLTTLRF